MTAPKTRFVFNPEIIPELGNRLGWRNYLQGMADDIKQGTKQNAKMTGYKKTVRFKTKSTARKLSAIVFTTWPLAHIDEWGSINNQPSAAMRRAVEATVNKTGANVARFRRNDRSK